MPLDTAEPNVEPAFEFDARPLGGLDDELVQELTELVIRANEPNRGPFVGPRLGPNTLREGYVGADVLMLRQTGELVGTATVRVDEEVLWVWLLAVLPSSRGQGLGGIILDECECIGRTAGAKALWLEAVDTGNLVAYYRSLGFAEVGRKNMPQGHWNSTRAFDLVSMERRFDRTSVD